MALSFRPKGIVEGCASAFMMLTMLPPSQRVKKRIAVPEARIDPDQLTSGVRPIC
jgi:hypothetical protein